MAERTLLVAAVVALALAPWAAHAQGSEAQDSEAPTPVLGDPEPLPPPPPPPPGDPAPPAGYAESASATATPTAGATPAQPPPGGFVPQPRPTPVRSRPSVDGAYSGARVEVDYFGTSFEGVDIRYLGTNFYARVAVSEKLELFARWGLGSASAEAPGGPSEDGFVVQNPFFGISALMNTNPIQTYRIGAGIGVPLASDGDSLGDVLARDIGIGASALWDLHLWAPDTVALEFHIENIRRYGALVMSGRTQLVLLAYTGDAFSDRGADFAWNWDLGVSGSWDQEGSGVGLRLRSAWIPTAEDALGADFYQIALEPFIEQWFGPFGVSARLTMNIDAPYGFAFEDDGVWALHFGARYRARR